MKFKVGDVVITKKCPNHKATGPHGPQGATCTIRSIDPDDAAWPLLRDRHSKRNARAVAVLVGM